MLLRPEEADPPPRRMQGQAQLQEGKQVAGRADRHQDNMAGIGGSAIDVHVVRSRDRHYGIKRSARRRANRSKNELSVAW